LPIEQDSVSRLVAETRAEHRNDIFQTDEKLLAFALNPPSKGRYNKAATVKGIFKANHCPLSISLPTPEPPRPTKKIDSETLKAIYAGLPRDELRAIIDLQAYAGERVACLCELTPISDWTDHGKYVLIHIVSQNTKARYTHVSIIPKPLAAYLRAYARALGRTTPFPNYETLWREIRQFAISKFGIRLTSHYLRKRFATIASKTTMPVNSWDYLMGDKPSLGHHAEAYALEDYSGLVEEYDRYLAPYLSIPDMKEPDAPKEPIKQDTNILLETIKALQETVKLLTAQLAEARAR